jgi:hypothetical protein
MRLFTGHVLGGQFDGAGLHSDKVVLDVKLRIPGRDVYVWRKLRVPYELTDALSQRRIGHGEVTIEPPVGFLVVQKSVLDKTRYVQDCDR